VFSLGKVKSWKVTEIFSANRSEEGIRLWVLPGLILTTS
jgi:hypothetical protein